MPYTLFIARRYFFSRKQKTVINIISWISLVGIAVSTAALIVVLSVYNGIGNLTQSLFNSFDPQLLVQPAKGKTFHTASLPLDSLQHLSGVTALSQIAEENAWITYRHNQAIVTLRGVDDQYPQVSGLDTLLYEGVYGLKIKNGTEYANTAIPGIEEIGKVKIHDRRQLALCKSDGSIISSEYRINDLRLNDWDTLFIRRM